MSKTRSTSNTLAFLATAIAIALVSTIAAQSSTGSTTTRVPKSPGKLFGDAPKITDDMTDAERDYALLMGKVREARIAHMNRMREQARKAREAAAKAKAEGQPMRARTMSIRMNPALPPEVLAGFEGAAAKYTRTDDAIRFLVYLLGAHSDVGKVRATAKRLLTDHLQSKALVAMPPVLPRLRSKLGSEGLGEVYRQLIETSPHNAVRASALFARATTFRPGASSDEGKARNLADVEAALALDPRGAFAKRAEGILFEARRLAIGCVAPNIEGKDTDGIPFTLHDYKGKVIMLDFWGDW